MQLDFNLNASNMHFGNFDSNAAGVLCNNKRALRKTRIKCNTYMYINHDLKQALDCWFKNSENLFGPVKFGKIIFLKYIILYKLPKL